VEAQQRQQARWQWRLPPRLQMLGQRLLLRWLRGRQAMAGWWSS